MRSTDERRAAPLCGPSDHHTRSSFLSPSDADPLLLLPLSDSEPDSESEPEEEEGVAGRFFLRDAHSSTKRQRWNERPHRIRQRRADRNAHTDHSCAMQMMRSFEVARRKSGGARWHRAGRRASMACAALTLLAPSARSAFTHACTDKHSEVSTMCIPALTIAIACTRSRLFRALCQTLPCAIAFKSLLRMHT